jgi:hypothetical protein
MGGVERAGTRCFFDVDCTSSILIAAAAAAAAGFCAVCLSLPPEQIWERSGRERGRAERDLKRECSVTDWWDRF